MGSDTYVRYYVSSEESPTDRIDDSSLLECVVKLPVPAWCTWKFITQEDVIRLRNHPQDEKQMLLFFEKKLEDDDKLEANGKYLFAEVLWKIFKLARDNSFNERGLSAGLGIFWLTHAFFLSDPRRTARDIYEFFRETVLLHAVTNPPKSCEVLTVFQCELLFKTFEEIYLRNLGLLHYANHDHCYFRLSLDHL